MIQTKELIYEYEKRDEEGNIIGMKRAIDGVDIDIPEGSFVAILGPVSYTHLDVYKSQVHRSGFTSN